VTAIVRRRLRRAAVLDLVEAAVGPRLGPPREPGRSKGSKGSKGSARRGEKIFTVD
jgi:hypothetical protein